MKRSQAIDRLRQVIRRQHKALATEKTLVLESKWIQKEDERVSMAASAISFTPSTDSLIGRFKMGLKDRGR